MKLRALELEQFRKFERAVRVSGFSDGLNVLCGPNELGKSTVLAAIRGVIFERHTSKAEPVRRMQPHGGGAAPRLAMEFEVESGRWRIEKRFIHQPSARLTGPDGHSFDGDAAEERLQQLLGFGAAGKRGASAEQLGVWGALWVEQRQSFLQPDLTSDLARSTVASCLDAEVGVLTGSERGQFVMRAVREKLAELQDGNGRPKNRYKQVIADIKGLDGQLSELRARALRLGEDAEDLRRKSVVLIKTDDRAAVRDEEAALLDARRRRDAARLFDERRSAVQAQLELARQKLIDAEQEAAVRRARLDAIGQARTKMAGDASRSADARARALEFDALLTKRRVAAAEAEERGAAALETVRRRREDLVLVQRAAELADFTAALERAEADQQVITGMLAKLAAIRLDGTAIQAIRQAVRDRDAAHAVLQAQATAIDLDLDLDAAGRVTIDGAAAGPGRHTLAAVTPTQIAVAGVGRILVRPAIRDRDKLLVKAAQSTDRLQSLLNAAGCADADDAERAWSEREQIEAGLRDGRARLAVLAPGDARSGLAAGLEALRERVGVLRRQLEANDPAARPDLPHVATAALAATNAEAADLEAREALTQARAELDVATSASAEGRAALTSLDSEAQATRSELERLVRETEAAAALEPDAALAARIAAATLERQRCAGAAAVLEAERPADTVETLDVRIQRYEQAQKNRVQNVQRLREEIAGLRARITQEGGAGLDEAIAAAAREHDLLARERDATAHDVQVLTLLLGTLAAAERESKERYLAPVVRRVTPYLRSLFPGADIRCDDTLRITGVSRGPDGIQDFERLSDGTQEQIAVLARLAFADLLKDQGKPAMLILDDALAWSDDERIERMFDILTIAARRTQIIILTCREDLFSRLAGSRLEIVAMTAVAA